MRSAMQKKDGSIVPMDISISLLKDNGSHHRQRLRGPGPLRAEKK